MVSPAVMAMSSRTDAEVSPSDVVGDQDQTGAAAHRHEESFCMVTHESLFEADSATRCDVCGASFEVDTNDSLAVTGAGAYLRARGGEVEIERVPLCARCASAIGLSALARWEIEEEEG
jgi:hypothetical protein